MLDFKSPYEVLKGTKLNLSHLKVFGCTYFVHIQSSHRDKLDPRAVKCCFLGYSSTQKGYRCYNPKTNKIVVSRDVKFKEANPFFKPSVDSSGQGENLLDLLPIPCLADVECPSTINVFGQEESHAPQVLIPNQEVQTESSNTSSPTHEPSQVSTHTAQVRCNPTRERNPPPRLLDYVTYNARYPLADCITYDKFSSSHATFLSALNGAYEPRSFQEANLCDEWKKAMAEELQALHENQTWSVIKLPKGKKVVGSRWVYKTKLHSDGTIERHKARLVARGFTQTYGVDYKETFAPVAKRNTVRVLLSVAINHAWPLFQMDVKNPFFAWRSGRGSLHEAPSRSSSIQ